MTKKAKAKNPLYVVKGKDVHEATDWIDMLVKKWNLEPVYQYLKAILEMILEELKKVNSYSVMSKFNELLEQVLVMVQAFIPFKT